MRKPNGYWTKERLQEEALKYETRSEFHKNSSGAYDKAFIKDVLDEICSHMIEIRKPKIHLSFDQVKEIALKYENKKQFLENDYNVYSIASRKNWLNDSCLHMIELRKPNNYWTKEMCHKEALKYKTRTEFRQFSNVSYNISFKNKWLNEVCSHMDMLIKPVKYWNDKDLCRKEAMKYKTRTSFSKGSVSAYNSSWRNGYLDDICFHMKDGIKPDNYWSNKENCKIEALKYKARTEFKRSSNMAYESSRKNKWLDEFFPKKIKS